MVIRSQYVTVKAQDVKNGSIPSASFGDREGKSSGIRLNVKPKDCTSTAEPLHPQQISGSDLIITWVVFLSLSQLGGISHNQGSLALFPGSPLASMKDKNGRENLASIVHGIAA